MCERPVRVCLVDDQRLVREGLCALIGAEEKFEVVAQAGSCSEAVSEAMRSAPDLMVIEYLLPDGCGIDVISAVADKLPSMRILLVGQGYCREASRRSLRAGANGFVQKMNGSSHLLDAMRAIALGENWFERMSRPMRGADMSAPLTSRERSVMGLMAIGGTNEDIASNLRISVATVKTHVYNLMQKLDAKNRAEAVHKARGIGLVERG